MNLFYEDGPHPIEEGNNFLAKDIMNFYKELSLTVYNPPRISYKNIPSFSYNTDDFLPLLSNKTSRQSTSVYIPIKPRERNSKVVSFFNTVNLLLL